jgi:8-oxo-dGTP pyrophosphatase MutT (NUDIX family)
MDKKKIQVVIMSPCGEVLLLRTNKRRGQFWQNVTGSSEKNETLHEAAIRELSEETGIQYKSISTLKELPITFHFKDQWGDSVTEQSFLCLLHQKTDTIILDPDEHNLYKWKKIQEISSNDYKFQSNYQTFLEAKQYV